MPILDKWTLDFVSSSVEQTVRLGVRLGELLQPGDVVCLYGDLGAGKTAVARGVGRGWGTGLRVTSPTFTLVNQYPRLKDGRVLFHVDCYRLETTADVWTVGLEDIFDDRQTMIIEWPERLSHLLPADRLEIHLAYLNETRRSLRFSATGPRAADLLADFKQSAFGV